MSKVFEWDLMSIADMMPTHILNYLLANGVVFENELTKGNISKGVELAGRISDKAQIMLDTYVWERGNHQELLGKPASIIAASIIHAARQEEALSSKKETLLANIWPRELEILTRCRSSEVEQISALILKLNAMQP